MLQVHNRATAQTFNHRNIYKPHQELYLKPTAKYLPCRINRLK